ncbi:MAG: cellulose binding domain-containing protein [Micromonosporaceae bacterium]|nr:cellulose binding domain-containing protein [Micromonosporaceae bacterium]
MAVRGNHRRPGWGSGGGRRVSRWRGLFSLGLSGLVVATVTVTALVSSSDWPAGAVSETDRHTGRATYYSLGDSGLGNCSFPVVPADRLYAALGPEDYDHAGGCGGYIDVTGPKGTVRVLAADKCPECESGHLDMSPEAFAKIGDLTAGVIPISYQGVKNPEGAGPVTIRVKEGSSQWWIGFLATNHGNPLAAMEYRTEAGEWQSLKRAEYNYWLKEDGAGPGPFTLRLTDVYGNQAIVDDIALSPTVNQSTDVRMYESGAVLPDQSPSAGSSGAAPSASVTATATALPVPSEGSNCSALATVDTMWPTGFQATVTVRNDDVVTLEPWTVTWALPSDVAITTSWGATVTQSGSAVTARAPGWNGAVVAGGTVSIGFNADRPLGPGTVLAAVAGSVQLNGATCLIS